MIEAPPPTTDSLLHDPTTDSLIRLPAADKALCIEVLTHLINELEGPRGLDDLELDDDPDLGPDLDLDLDLDDGLDPDPDDDPDVAPAGIDHLKALTSIAPLVESMLASEPSALPPEFHARLAAAMDYPSVPESVAVQIAFGRAVGEEAVSNLLTLIAEAWSRRLEVDDHVAELQAMDAIPKDDAYRRFRGELRDSPSAERIRRGIAALRVSASLLLPGFRPPVLCAIAWLQWARGRRALAMAYLAEASRIEPTNVLAYGLAAHFSDHLPLWCGDV